MSKHPIAERRLVVITPAMETVVVQRDTPFGGEASPHLRMDIYRPSEDAAAPLPVVIFVTGYSDVGSRQMLGCKLKDMASYVDWARLIASSGMIAITYENEEPVRDLRLLLRHIRANAVSLGIDPARIGVWSCSGNVPNALALLQQPDEPIRCAALCYGYMLDTDGSDDVASAAEKFGFAAPAVRIDPEPFRRLPMLVVRAGLDEMPGLNQSIDRFTAQALGANLPVTVVNHATGPHAFDILDSTEESRMTVLQILQFLTLNLLEDAGHTWR